jgi:hypothetical protein
MAGDRMSNKTNNEIGWAGFAMIVICFGMAVVCLYAFLAWS